MKTHRQITVGELIKRHETERAAGDQVGCVATYKGDGGHGDRYECSCGWESNTYWDGDHWAWQEWVDHIKRQGATVEYT